MRPSFKVVLLKKVFVGLMNSARDPHKKRRCESAFLFNAIQTCTKGPFNWRSGKVGGWKSGRLEKIWFSLMCVWLQGWKSVLKLFLLKKVFASPMNSTRDPHKKRIYTSTFLFNAIQTCTKGSFDWRSGKVGG